MTHKPRIPRLAPGVDVRVLPLTPLEGFVLSRVDGAATVGDLADLTNQSTEECSAVIERLLALRAIEWADGAVSLPRTSTRPSSPGSSPRAAVVPDSNRPSTLPRGSSVEEQKNAPTSLDRRSEPPPARAGARQEILDRQKLPFRPTEFPAPSSPPVSPAPSPAPPRPADVVPPVTGNTTAGGTEAPAPEDDLEISPERRKRIDDLWIALDLLNHYEILGISQKASRAEVRAAYFDLSKAFHPDTAFRKKVGNYRTKMEAIFKRLTEAYDVLGKSKPREEYDAYLLSIGEAKDAEEALSGEHEVPPELREPRPETKAAREEPTLDKPNPANSTPPRSFLPPAPSSPPARPTPGAITPDAPQGHPLAGKSTSGTMPAVRTSPDRGGTIPGGIEAPLPPTSTPRPISDESRRRAAELFQRRLEGARGNRTTPPSFPAAAPRSREDMARELKSAITASASLSGGVLTGTDLVLQHLADARRAEAQGELAMAVRSLRIALAAAPDRLELAAEHERVAKLLAVSLADRYTDQATYEERTKKWGAAAISWSKVLEGRPDDFAALLGAATCLVEAQGDLRKAQRFAQRAVDLFPQTGASFRVLARVCLAAALPLNARRALQQALAIDPNDAQAKQLLEQLAKQGG